MSYVATLNEADIEFGRRLWQLLRDAPQFPVAGILWLLEPEAGEWRLVIASSRVDEVGPRNAYRELAAAAQVLPPDSIQWLKIEMISPKHPLYEALRSVFGKTLSVEGARLGSTMVGGTFIDEAYLYEVR